MCLSLALVCSEVDGIVVIYLWPPSFAYSKILTRGRYLSRHSRCLRCARVLRRRLSLANEARPAFTPPRRRRPTRKCGRRQAPLEVHEQPLSILHLLDQARVAEPRNFIPVFALGVLLGAAPASALESIGILDLDVPSLGTAHPDRFAGGHLVPARDALLRAVLSTSRRFSRQAPWYSRSIATNSLRDGCPHAVVPTETTSSQPPEAPPSHARRRRTPPSAAVPRPSFRLWTPWWAALVVRGGQRPNRFASRLGC